ncbi:MAG: gamma-glutamyltransferase [Phycisphaeraceae bacterium]|nr:gamma-glutamyltransferase [Phycisphaeraceae bacterium]
MPFRSLVFVMFALALTSCAESQTASKAVGAPKQHSASVGRPAQANGEPTYRHVVAADHEIASRAGLEMLRKGGNAVDAAVAASFTLSVVRPYSCGIGGGGFMMIHLKTHARLAGLPRTIALDYREVAPSWAKPDFFETDPKCKDDPSASTNGAHAVAIPGSVAGLLDALEKYGTLPRQTVLAPAIRAAEEGFAVDADYMRAAASSNVARGLKEGGAQFAEFRSIFLMNGQIKEGDVLKQPAQARALRLISRDGAKAFYSGEIASAIRNVLAAGGASVTAAELAAYRPRELLPLTTIFQGKLVFAFPPPSSGGIVLIQTLGMIEARRAEFDSFEYASSAQIHFLTEAFKHSFADRSRFLADPAVVDIPVLALTSQSNTRELAARIDMAHTQPIDSYGSIVPRGDSAAPKDAGTSHLSVVDSWGNAVACTETINLQFGSLVCVPGFGFILNDQMDDFTTRRGKPNAFGLRQDDRNLPAPGKQPLSSMSPTIVLSGDAENSPVELVVGGSGGPWIITGTLQVMLDCLTYGIPASRAVAQPRIHHQWMPDTLRIEPEIADAREGTGAQTRTVGAGLNSRGQELKLGKSECVIQVIRRSPSAPVRYEAGSDPRKGGKPAGE